MTLVAFTLSAQVPDAPNPPKLVNDFAGIFTAGQVQELEDSLELFARATSNQVVVVTVRDLGGMDRMQFAYEIGQKWGVGGKKFNNGVVLLVKPKDSTRGETFIATGYGVEGALPDGTCKLIIEREMIPQFKEGDYYGGVNAALKVIKPILAKEYSYKQYEDDSDASPWWAVIPIIVIMAIVLIGLISGKGGKNGNSGTMGGGGFFIGGIPFGGGSGSSGGGGGFGGFGGGGFGGGGAGGSW